MLIEVKGFIDRGISGKHITYNWTPSPHFGYFEPNGNGRPALWWNCKPGEPVSYTASWRYVKG
jgi:hypothetical protein